MMYLKTSRPSYSRNFVHFNFTEIGNEFFSVLFSCDCVQLSCQHVSRYHPAAHLISPQTLCRFFFYFIFNEGAGIS